MKPFECFKPGKHRDMSGSKIDFTEEMVKAMAAVYDPEGAWKAPLVVGHPKSNDPAFGWAKGLEFKDGQLIAEPDQVYPAFAEGVESGLWPNRSASFYLPDSPNNPKPGTYYLRHIGFLGAQPPAIKGLAPVEFAGSDEGTVEIAVSFGESESRISRILRSVRELFIEKFGTEAADRALPSWELESLEELADDPEFSEEPVKPKEDPVSRTTKKGPETKPGLSNEEINTRLTDLETREAAFAESQRRDIADTAVKAAIDDGRLSHGQADGLVNFMAGLNETEDTVSFGEGDDETSVSQVAFMKTFLSRLSKQVDYSEHGAGVDPVPASSEDLAMKAVAYQEDMRAKGTTITTSQAVAHVAASEE